MRSILPSTSGFIIYLLMISSSFSSRYTLEEDLCLTIVLSRAQNFCINRCKQKRLRILWYPVLAKNETNAAKNCETFTIHAYFIADFPRLNFLYHICKKVFFTNSRQLFLSIFVGVDRINQSALATKLFLFFFTLFNFLYLTSGSCYLDRASNDEFSVECLFWFFQPTWKAFLN